MTKTYIARGLLEYQTTFTVAGATLRICFSGGSMGINGVIPARYTTDNPAIQRIIEDSSQFKNHRIALLREYSEEKNKKDEDES